MERPCQPVVSPLLNGVSVQQIEVLATPIHIRSCEGPSPQPVKHSPLRLVADSDPAEIVAAAVPETFAPKVELTRSARRRKTHAPKGQIDKGGLLDGRQFRHAAYPFLLRARELSNSAAAMAGTTDSVLAQETAQLMALLSLPRHGRPWLQIP